MTWARVKDGELLGFVSEEPNVDQSTLAAGKPRILPVVTESDPFDAVSQVQEGPAYEVEAARVVRRFTSRAKNQNEIARMIAKKDAAIDAEFLRLCIALIDYEVGGITYQFHTDAEAVGNISGILNAYTEADRMGNPRPDPRMWKPKGSMPIQISRNEIAGLGIAIADRKDALFVIRVLKQATLAAMTDPAEIDAVDPLTGWDID